MKIKLNTFFLGQKEIKGISKTTKEPYAFTVGSFMIDGQPCELTYSKDMGVNVANVMDSVEVELELTLGRYQTSKVVSVKPVK